MSPLIPDVRGLTLVGRVVQIGVYGLAIWTYADQRGLSDEVVDSVKTLIGLPVELLRLAATPGGGRA